MSISKKRFYTDEQYDEYVENQINLGKKDKIRNPYEYINVVNCMGTILNNTGRTYRLDEKFDMVCLGARNGFEKEVFEYCWEQGVFPCNVYDLDLDPGSGCDFIYDFADLPEDWKDKWDFIYTNCPDHAFDGEKALLEWIRVLNPGGVLIVGWSPINYENDGHQRKDAFDGLDCSYYNSFEEIEKWFCSQPGVSVLGKFGKTVGYPESVVVQEDGCVFNYFLITKEAGK